MPDSFKDQLQIADVYAAALFDLARETGQIETVRHELDELLKLEQASPEFAAFMSSAAIDADKRAAALENTLRGKLSDDVLNTLLVLNRHGRYGMTAALARCYVLRQEAAANQVEATVTSAVKLSREQQKEIAATVQRVSGKTPLVDYVVDPAVIGGLIVQVGDTRYDNSVRQKLAGARRRLAERSDRGLATQAAE